ncbi:interleukin-3-like [Mustela lutreola]|uniref:interleukin-3-like n=1 Tax=Mustela lutreola TaxID=9666 RepID=UPI0027976EB9|nr:interleukin-3-like [Mustela lutreola]
MNSLPVLHFLLLLLGLQAPQVQGRSLLTYPPQQNFKMISEIIDILNSSPSPAEETLDPNETNTLLNTTLLRPNLNAFLNATKYFYSNESLIWKNLKEFLPLLPTPTPMGEPISIGNNWSDFQKKLKKYLETLDNFLNFKNNH